MQTLQDLDFLPFIPHRPPMLLISRLSEANNESIIAEYDITEKCIFLNDKNQLEEAAYIEILAQAFAAGTGYIKNQIDLDFGFLAAIKEVSILEPASLGETVQAKVSIVAELANILVVEGELFIVNAANSQRKIGSGQFKIFLPDDTSK